MHPDKQLPELVAEKNSLDPSFVHAVRLLAEGKSSILLSLSYSEICAILYHVSSKESATALHLGEVQWPNVSLFEHAALHS